MINAAALQKDENGMFALASYPDCTEPYHGTWTGASVFVVGLDTPEPTLFVKGHRQQATKHAWVNKTTLDHVHVTSLCHDAVVDLLGS